MLYKKETRALFVRQENEATHLEYFILYEYDPTVHSWYETFSDEREHPSPTRQQEAETTIKVQTHSSN
jgi:hypothetical protein